MIKLRAYSSSIQCRQPRRVRQRCLSLFKKEKKKGMKYDLGFESGLSATFEQKSHPLHRPVSSNHNGVYFYLPSCFEEGLAGSFRALLLPLPLEDGVGGWFGEMEGEGRRQ